MTACLSFHLALCFAAFAQAFRDFGGESDLHTSSYTSSIQAFHFLKFFCLCFFSFSFVMGGVGGTGVNGLTFVMLRIILGLFLHSIFCFFKQSIKVLLVLIINTNRI